MMKLIQLLLVFSLLIVAQTVFACSCFNIPCTFFDNEIRQEDHVVHVRVIGGERMEDGSRYAQMNDKLTRLLVLHSYTDKIIADTILFYHGDGAMCFRGLPNIELGTEYILRVTELVGMFEKNRYPNIYRMDLCSRPMLDVNGNKVTGLITRNRACKKLQAAMKRNESLSDADKIDLNQLRSKRRARNQNKSLKKFGKIWNRYKEAHI